MKRILPLLLFLLLLTGCGGNAADGAYQQITQEAVSYTHLTLPTNREV